MAYKNERGFKTVKVDGQDNVVADGATDEIEFVAGSNITITTDATNDRVTFASSGGGGGTNIADADGDTKIQVEESSDEDKIRFDTAGSQRMIITDAGKVGIGVAAPGYMLDVSGDVRIRGNDIRDNSGNAAITFDGSANVTVPNNLIVDGNGSTGGVTVTDGSVAIRTGTGNVAKVDFYCESSNAHKVTVKAPPHSAYSGDVTFQLPAGNGSSGQALITDGNGATSWSTISGGGGSVRTVGVDTDGNGSTDNTLETSESLILKAGSNVTLSEAAGVVTINSSASGGGGSSESSDSYTLGYATLNASTSGTVSGALTVPAGKTITGFSMHVDTAFVHSYGGAYHSGHVSIAGSGLSPANSSDTLIQPRAAYENYGSVSSGTSYWGAAGAHAASTTRLVVGSSNLDIDFKWLSQSQTLTAGSATIKVYYI